MAAKCSGNVARPIMILQVRVDVLGRVLFFRQCGNAACRKQVSRGKNRCYASVLPRNPSDVGSRSKAEFPDFCPSNVAQRMVVLQSKSGCSGLDLPRLAEIRLTNSEFKGFRGVNLLAQTCRD